MFPSAWQKTDLERRRRGKGLQLFKTKKVKNGVQVKEKIL